MRTTIIATGTEVPLAVDVANMLGDAVQVVSMPSVEHFRLQFSSYKKQILRGRVVVIEASSPAPWFEFADAVIGVNRFGLSGPGAAVYTKMGFNVEQIVSEIKNLMKQ